MSVRDFGSPPRNPIERLVQALSQLPGLGEKSSTRLALFLLRDTKGVAREVIDSLEHVLEKVRFCANCQNLTEEELCAICRDPERDSQVLCVVQEPVDVMMFERTEEYRGLYHVLHGVISPLDGVGPDDIRIRSLEQRVKSSDIREIILATNPNAEGEATALYLKKIFAEMPIKISRLASGMTVGGTVEYTDPKTLARALTHRHVFGN